MTALGVGAGGLLAGCSGTQNEEGSPTSTGDLGPTENTDVSVDSGTSTPGEGEELGEAVEPTVIIERAGIPSTLADANFMKGSDVTVLNYSPKALMTTMPFVNEYISTVRDSVEFIPLLFEDTELLEGNTVWELTLNDGFTWHNGEPVTVEDYIYDYKHTWYMQKAMGEEPTFKSIEKVDDRTIRHELHESQSAGVFYGGVQPLVNHPRWHMKQFYEMAMDATTEREANRIEDEMLEYKIGIDDFVGNGLYQVADWNEQELRMSLYEDHPYADRQNITEIVSKNFESSAAERLAWEDGSFDMGDINPTTLQLPPKYKSVSKPELGGEKIMFDQTNTHFQHREVRRAFSFYADNYNVAANKNFEIYPAAYQNGLPSALNSQIWDNWEEKKDQYIQYGSRAKPERGAEMLRQAGYSKNSDDKWVNADGELLEITVNAYEWWDDELNAVLSSLNREGWTAEPNFISGDEFWGNHTDHRDWDAAAWMHQAFPLNTPYAPLSFSAAPRGHLLEIEQENGETLHYAGRPWEIEVPSELGQMEVSGSGQTLDLLELQSGVTGPIDDNDLLFERLDQLAHYINYDMPAHRTTYDGGRFTWDNQNFLITEWTGDGYPDSKERGPSVGFGTGRWRGKTEDEVVN
jgi:ABC-type transport system substrate-binding protein